MAKLPMVKDDGYANEVNILSNVISQYPTQISNSGVFKFYQLGEHIGVISCQIMITAAISGSSVALPNTIPIAKTISLAPLGGLGTAGGFIQIDTNRNLTLRAKANSSEWTIGQLIFPI